MYLSLFYNLLSDYKSHFYNSYQHVLTYFRDKLDLLIDKSLPNIENINKVDNKVNNFSYYYLIIPFIFLTSGFNIF